MRASPVEVYTRQRKKVPNPLTQAGGDMFRRMVLVKAQMSEDVEIFNTSAEFILSFCDRKTVLLVASFFMELLTSIQPLSYTLTHFFFFNVTLKSINPKSKAQ